MGQQVSIKNVLSENENFAYEEAIKTLRTNIRYCGSNIRVVMLTSSQPEEGKSSLALMLARSIAKIGSKTLLLDADIRKSVLAACHQPNQNIYGLSQYLSGQRGLEEVICSTNVEHLNMIFAGPCTPNPAELLEEEAFGKLIQWARGEYDYIIVDTPPASRVIDAAIIAKECDGVVLVIESGMVSWRTAQAVKRQMDKTGSRMLGVVLNRADSKNSGYYGKHYSKYYGKDARFDG